MINFGIIGTNWITHSYVECTQATGKWNLVAVYSRKEETAKEFANKYNQKINIHTTTDALAADSSIDTVYIASPNSFHYEQGKQMLEAGKHVVLEKPLACTMKELDSLFSLAYSKNLILIEPYRHLHEVNFKILKKSLENLGPILGASINFGQYSSRYDAVLKGELPNIFNLDFGGGCLVDLGVYPVSFAIELFGEPKNAVYNPVIIRTGADGGGTLTLTYNNFSVQLMASKLYTATLPTEIYGEKGTLSIPSVTDIETVTFIDPRKKGEKTALGKQKEDLNLKEEADEIGRIIEEKDFEAMKRWEKVSRGVQGVTEKVRHDNGLLFPVEKGAGGEENRGTGTTGIIGGV